MITFEEIRKCEWHKIELMNERDIKMWLEEGLELRPHGLIHEDLSSIFLDLPLLEEKTLSSKEILVCSYNIKVNTFCYSFGSFNNIVKDVEMRYYRYAFTVNKGIILNSESIRSLWNPNDVRDKWIWNSFYFNLIRGEKDAWRKSDYC